MKTSEAMEIAENESRAATDEMRYQLSQIGVLAKGLKDPALLRELGKLHLAIAHFLRSYARLLEAAEEANP